MNDHSIKLWNIETGQEIGLLSGEIWEQDSLGRVVKVVKGHSDTIESLDFNKSGKLLASASYDGTVRIWKVKSHTGQIIQSVLSGLMRYVGFNCTEDELLTLHEGAVNIWKRNAVKLSYALARKN